MHPIARRVALIVAVLVAAGLPLAAQSLNANRERNPSAGMITRTQTPGRQMQLALVVSF